MRKSLADVLTRLRQEFGIAIAWSGDLIPNVRVSMSHREATVRDVITAALTGTDLEFVVTRIGTIVIVPSRRTVQPATPPPGPDDRAVTRTLQATGVAQLDAVVVTGSPVTPRPEREQPTAIGIVRPSHLAPGSYASVSDVIRTYLPGVILWDRGLVGAPPPIAALRGVSSFTTRAVKTYVDGVELASPELFTLLDARSIDRIELIRGPQGAALYGPDALNGVLRIETRHGQPGRAGIHPRGSVAAGSLARAEFRNADFVQDYAGGVSASRGLSAIDVGGAFGQTGLGGQFPRMKSWSVNGGARSLIGRFTIDASARAGYREYSVDSVNNAGEGVVGSRRPRALEERAVALSVVHAPGETWKHTVIAGHQRSDGVREAFHSPLIAPTLPLGATGETASRSTIRYSATVEAAESITLSGGLEHSLRTIARRGAAPMSLYQGLRDLRSTGAFVQARARIGQRLVISGGTRGERSSSVDPGIGVTWASTAGASWSHESRMATVRLRAAWGNAIRPPEPGMNMALERPGLQQIANAELRPERQRGMEGGADIFLPGGAYIKYTFYDQRAIDLIQPTLTQRPQRDATRYVFQNVGAVINRGSELEAGVQRGRLGGTINAYFPLSRVARLGRSYTGEFRVGDKLLEVPDAAGSAAIAYQSTRMRIETGVSWVGSWIGYDRELIARIEREQSEPLDSRAYWRVYGDVVRPFVMLSAIAAPFHAFLRIDNLGDADDAVRDNLSPSLGRTIMLGISRDDQRR